MKYGQFCPIAKATEIVCERWTLLIIRELLLGTTRFTDFQRALSQISPTLLTKRLNQLVDEGLAIRRTPQSGKRAEYHPTVAAKELGPIVIGLGEWGMRWARGRMSDDELDDLDLATLPDDELVTQMHDDLYDGLKDEIEDGVNILLGAPVGETSIQFAMAAMQGSAF